MPYDSEVSRLQGEITQLEKEIEAIQNAIEYVKSYSVKPTTYLYSTINRLKDNLEHKQMKLSTHRQHTKESGVKY